MSIVVFGSINMDITTYVPRLPDPGETIFGHSFITVPGGKGANQAVATARLGVDTKMIGRVGKDGFGSEHLSALQSEGVDTSAVLVDDNNSTGLAVISVDDDAENSIIVISGANMALDDEDVSRCKLLLSEADAVMLQNEVPLEANLAVARDAHECGIAVILDPAPARTLPDELFPYIRVITPNEIEAEALVGFPIHSEMDAARAAAHLRRRGVGSVVIKMGQEGAYYECEDGSGTVAAFEVEAVDTVAAGDSEIDGIGREG